MTPRPGPGRAGGYVLVVCMLLLVGASLVGVALLRFTTLQERLASNTREKQRALEAAQSALRYGEQWLLLGNPGSGTECKGEKTAAADLQACSNPLSGSQGCLDSLKGSMANPENWPARFTYIPAGMTVAAGGGVAASGDANYASAPGLYIEYAGTAPGGVGVLYCVTGYGGGASAGTLAVVRSLFMTRAGVRSADPAP